MPGEHNPADCGTRGLSPFELKSSAWLTGPAFLLESESHWPEDFVPQEPVSAESDATVLLSNVSVPNAVQWDRFSSFCRLRRSLVFVRRFINSCRGNRAVSDAVTAEEIQQATTDIWLLVQRESFSSELSQLLSSKPLPSSSCLKQLAPFVDTGVLRAKGRLRKARDLPFATRHPIILDSRHPAIELFLRHSHVNSFHQGVEYLRSVLQQGFWILKLRNALRSIANTCIVCRAIRAQPFQPQMADLPVSHFPSRRPV